MPAIPLGLEAYVRTRGVTPETILRNLYLEEDKSGQSPDQTMRIQRPGLTSLVDFGVEPRGIFQLDGVLSDLTFVVAGDKLYSTDWSTKTLIATVPDDGQLVAMGANAFKLGLVTAGEFWTSDGETAVKIELPDDRSPCDLDVINGYFVLPVNDGRFYWLAPDQDDFSSADAILQYATAESTPDGLYGVRRLRDELFFFGTATVEVWQATGLSDATFERASGRTLDRGAHSRDCIRVFDNSVVFVGDDGICYRISDVPTRISTNGIEERIAKRTNSCSAFTFTSQGHKFYCLVIPGQGTFAFDAQTSKWSEFSTLGQTLWEVTYAIDTPNGPVAGNTAGKLLALDPDATTDNGNLIERVVSGTIALPPTRISNPHLAIWGGASADSVLTIRWRDGRDTDWRATRTVTLRAGSTIENVWRLGVTKGAFRHYEISTTADAFVRLSGALANEGRASG